MNLEIAVRLREHASKRNPLGKNAMRRRRKARGTLGSALRAGRDQPSFTLAVVVPFALTIQASAAQAWAAASVVGSALVAVQVLVVALVAARA